MSMPFARSTSLRSSRRPSASASWLRSVWKFSNRAIATSTIVFSRAGSSPSTTYAETPACTALRIVSGAPSLANMTIGRGVCCVTITMCSRTSRLGESVSMTITSGRSFFTDSSSANGDESDAVTSHPAWRKPSRSSSVRSSDSSTTRTRIRTTASRALAAGKQGSYPGDADRKSRASLFPWKLRDFAEKSHFAGATTRKRASHCGATRAEIACRSTLRRQLVEKYPVQPELRHRVRELSEYDRLPHVAVGAELVAAQHVFIFARRRENHHGNQPGAGVGAQLLQNLEAA